MEISRDNHFIRFNLMYYFLSSSLQFVPRSPTQQHLSTPFSALGPSFRHSHLRRELQSSSWLVHCAQFTSATLVIEITRLVVDSLTIIVLVVAVVGVVVIRSFGCIWCLCSMNCLPLPGTLTESRKFLLGQPMVHPPPGHGHCTPMVFYFHIHIYYFHYLNLIVIILLPLAIAIVELKIVRSWNIFAILVHIFFSAFNRHRPTWTHRLPSFWVWLAWTATAMWTERWRSREKLPDGFHLHSSASY